MSVPVFRHDAKAFGDELVSVLARAFPAEDPALEWAAQAQADGLTYTERLERVASMVAGEQRRVLAATAALAPETRRPFPGAEWTEWSLYGEIAALLQLSPGSAEFRLEQAKRLADVLPATLAKLRGGELSVAKAIVMLEETVNLDTPEAGRVDVDAMKNTRGTRAQFRYRVRRLVAKIDPEATIQKRKKARKDAVGANTFACEDGINCINVFAPAEDAALGWAAIEQRAKELRAAGDTRSIHELRAAAAIDLLTKRADGTSRVTAQIQVLVPVGTLLGISDDDAHIPGHGDIPAEVARDLAEQSDDVQRSLVDPETGALLDVTSTKYRPRLKKLRRVLKPGERPIAADTNASECGDRFAPDDGGATMCGDRFAPDDGGATMCGDRFAPDHGGATMCGDRFAPDDDRATTCGNRSAPDDDRATTCGNRSAPDDRRATPSDERPAADESCRTNRVRDTCVQRRGKKARRTITSVRLPGFGQLPPEVVELIADDPEWQRLLTDPDTSERLDAHPDTYKPGIALMRFIKLRDRHCRFPGCHRPARLCDLDHTIPHGRMGGLTIRRNLACLRLSHELVVPLPGSGRAGAAGPSGRLGLTEFEEVVGGADQVPFAVHGRQAA